MIKSQKVTVTLFVFRKQREKILIFSSSKKNCPVGFDSFEFLSSIGASGGILTAWKSHVFQGHLVFSNDFGITMELTSKHNDLVWVLTNIYAPFTPAGKQLFTSWLKNIQMPQDLNWLIPLYGKRFTWTNKQYSPLLERLDWFFTSQSWTNTFPNTSISTLTMETSDHVPCLISISTVIPKGRVFRFENYLMEHEHFMSIVQHGWSLTTFQTNATKIITAKFKNLRRLIKSWQSQLSSLKANIADVKLILSFLGVLEEFRDLTLMKWNFKASLEKKLTSLLRQQKIYWK